MELCYMSTDYSVNRQFGAVSVEGRSAGYEEANSGVGSAGGFELVDEAGDDADQLGMTHVHAQLRLAQYGQRRAAGEDSVGEAIVTSAGQVSLHKALAIRVPCAHHPAGWSSGERMNRTRIRDNPEVRRAQILEEGIRLVGQHGYYGLTVQALAKRCGISNAGLLYYFSSKDQILLALLDELERREAEIMAPIVETALQARGPAGRAALVRMTHVMVERVVGQGSLGRFIIVLQAEALDLAHPAHDWFVERERLTLDLFVSLLQDMPNPLSTARLLYAVMHGLGLQWLRSEGAFNLIGEWEQASALILGTGPAPA